MSTRPHLRLVETAPTPRAPSRGGRIEPGSVTGDEQDIEAMLSDPVNDLVREMDRLIARQGPLSPEVAVRSTRKVAQAVIEAREARRYAVTRTHVLWIGSVLYFALTGKAPFAPRPGSSAPACPPKVASLSPYPVSQEIEELVATCLLSERGLRFGSVKELEEALAALPESQEAVEWFDVELPLDGDAAADTDIDRATLPPESGVSLTKAAAASAPVAMGRRGVAANMG